MKKPIAISLLLFAGTAGAQTYDPATGESPLSLLAVPRDGVAYYETKARARELVKSEKYVEAEPLAEQLVRPEGRQDKLVAPPGVAPPLFLRDVDRMHW